MKGEKGMNELKIFQNPEFGTIRAVELNGEPYFVGRDVAEILGYAKARNAIMVHVDDDDKKDAPIQGTLGGVQEMTVINESGLYSLILSSKLPAAKRFKRWVTAEVLPSIRKSGGYIAGAEKMTEAELMARALEVAHRINEEKNARIEKLEGENEVMKPKAIFADAVAASHSSILIGELAKILRGNGINIGQRRLFGWMREHKYLMNYGSSRNMPTQKAMDMGLFVIKEGTYIDGNGTVNITKTTKVTGKGQQYFINKFLAEWQH